MSFSTKINFKGEIRRFRVSDGTFDSLLASCRSLFGLPQGVELELTQVNRREGAKILVASSAQLADLLALRGGKMIFFNLSTKSVASTLPEAPVAASKPARLQRPGRRFPHDPAAVSAAAALVVAPTEAPALPTESSRPFRRHGPHHGHRQLRVAPAPAKVEVPAALPAEAPIPALADAPALSAKPTRPFRRHPRGRIATLEAPIVSEPKSDAPIADWKAQRLALREKIAQAKAEVRDCVAHLHALLQEARANCPTRPKKTDDVDHAVRRQLCSHKKMRLAAIRRARIAAKAQSIVAH